MATLDTDGRSGCVRLESRRGAGAAANTAVLWAMIVIDAVAIAMMGFLWT